MKKVMVLLLVFMIFSSSMAFAVDEANRREASGPEMILDVLVLRPCGIAATVVGTGFFIIALPFTAPTGSVKHAAQKLVVDPFVFTFMRPVGFDTADY